MDLEKIINVEYSSIQGSYWMIYGVICSFASAFLLSKGYSNSEIGIILAAANVLSVVMQPLVADFADRTKKFSLIGLSQLVTILLMALTVGLFVFERKTLALSLIFVLLIAWHTTLQPLINSLSFKLNESGINVSFGIARSMGSLFYAILMAFLGTLVENLGIRAIPVSAEIVMTMLLVSFVMTKHHFEKAKQVNGAAALKPAAGGETEVITAETGTSEEINLVEFIRRNKLFFLLNIGVLGVYFSNAVLNFYTMQIVVDVGGNSEDLGRVMSVMAFLEIPPMLFFGFLRKKFTCEKMLKFASIMFTIKIGVIFMAKSVMTIYAIQLIQMFSFALFLPAMVKFIDDTMSRGEAVKGQALYTMMTTVSSVIASVAGGIILDAYGAKTLTFVSTVITLLGALIIIACVDKVKQNKTPEPRK